MVISILYKGERVDKKFAVKSFAFYTGVGKEQGLVIRKVIEVGKDLKWEDAKKLRRETKDSWITGG